ncbi:unnamed protein product [Ostreobium quekettii]|uniref:NADH dehydrogenase [ubiquinone] 1 alpha subcomplex subunit 1 n=1 Tax=Ostreobium quekettii TaxID=121088 RepID=A0A8S1J7R1_9CHLO|nr:unnamed protein product [Ostreobium quekettii]
MSWWESAVPFGLIVGALMAMGNSQYLANHLYYGKPKATGLDEWDRVMARRDDRLKDGAFKKVTGCPPLMCCSVCFVLSWVVSTAGCLVAGRRPALWVVRRLTAYRTQVTLPQQKEKGPTMCGLLQLGNASELALRSCRRYFATTERNESHDARPSPHREWREAEFCITEGNAAVSRVGWGRTRCGVCPCPRSHDFLKFDLCVCVDVPIPAALVPFPPWDSCLGFFTFSKDRHSICGAQYDPWRGNDLL